ncbi:hypothetical protein [Streptomyces formicae]
MSPRTPSHPRKPEPNPLDRAGVTYVDCTAAVRTLSGPDMGGFVPDGNGWMPLTEKESF